MRYMSDPPTADQIARAEEHLEHRLKQWHRLQKWANTETAFKSMPCKTYTALDAMLQESYTYLRSEQEILQKNLDPTLQTMI